MAAPEKNARQISESLQGCKNWRKFVIPCASIRQNYPSAG
jgi:hypothetical protein